MNKLLTLVIYLLCVSFGFAQGELGVTLGGSIPSGDFASASGGDAKTGFGAGLLYQHHKNASSKLLMAGEFRFQSYAVDNSSLSQGLPPGVNIAATKWSVISVLLGPVLKVKLNDASSLEPRIMAGYMSASTPSLSASGGGASGNFPSSTAGAFAALVGINLKFKVAENTKFVFGVDYLTANPKFSASVGGQTQDTNQQVNSLNISIGFAFKL